MDGFERKLEALFLCKVLCVSLFVGIWERHGGNERDVNGVKNGGLD